MTSATLTLKNLARNPLRTFLTLAAIALPMFVFTIARSFVDAVERFLAESDSKMRVAVHQKLTYTAPLPQRLRGEIEALAPSGYVAAICRTTWFGGRLENKQTTFPSMAVDRDTFPIVYSEFGMTDEEMEAFRNQRNGAVIGRALANEMNWSIGDRVTLVGSIPPFVELDFVIAAIPADLTSPWFYFALDYYDEVYGQQTGSSLGVNNFWIRCNSPEARHWALTEIDRLFANSENETRTEMESTFFAAFARSGGNWVQLVWTVGELIVLVAIAVAFNTMSMTFRERTREIAVMRAVGFSAGRIRGMVLAEGLSLGILGGAIAVLPLYALTEWTTVSIPRVPSRVIIPASTVTVAMLVAITCGLLAALIPAVMAGRLKVAAALRKVV